MSSLSLARALPFVTFILLPLTGGCFENHVVGSDGTDGGSDSGSGDCAFSVDDCNEPVVPSGCTLSAGSCVDGQYKCPEVVCADGGNAVDAGNACEGEKVACSEPPIPSGCSLGPAGCDNGVYVCPAVVCPDDAGAVDAGSSCDNLPNVCNEPVVPPGCELGPMGCDNGVIVCPAVVCPDGGVDSGSTGSDFACGKAFCDAATEYCSITQGGVALPDSGTNMRSTCQAIPSACANNQAGAAATCACLQEHTSGTCTVSNGGDLTVTIDVP
jgi:hypothetical protein